MLLGWGGELNPVEMKTSSDLAPAHRWETQDVRPERKLMTAIKIEETYVLSS